MRSLDDPRQGCPNMMAPHLMGGGLSSSHRKTATEISMMQKAGYHHVKSYYQAIKHLPRKDRRVVDEAEAQVKMLESLGGGEYMCYSNKDEFFVDEWSIKTPELYHRHKELGTYRTSDGMAFTHWGRPDDTIEPSFVSFYETHVMWDAANGTCELCDVEIPGEIMMMHKFYQF